MSLVCFPANLGWTLEFLLVSQSHERPNFYGCPAILSVTGSKKITATGTRQTKAWGQRLQHFYMEKRYNREADGVGCILIRWWAHGTDHVLYDHSWSFITLHSWSPYTWSMQIMARGRRQSCVTWLNDWFVLSLTSIMDLQNPSHMFLFDAESTLMRPFPVLGRSGKLSCVLCISFVSNCCGCQPNWLVWQDPRRAKSLAQDSQDKPKTEDSVPRCSQNLCAKVLC